MRDPLRVTLQILTRWSPGHKSGGLSAVYLGRLAEAAPDDHGCVRVSWVCAVSSSEVTRVNSLWKTL